MNKKLTNPWKFDPHEIKKYTLQYKLLLTTQHNTNVPFNCPGFVAVDNVITSLYTLIRIRY